MRGLIFNIGLLLTLLAFLPASALAALVNINTADSTELQTLNGIGPVKAQAIIDYRNGPDGPFETIDEIKEVSGIGDATYNNIKDFITVGAASSPRSGNESSEVTNISSVRYGSTLISNAGKRMDISVIAGRNRAGTAGSPMEFVAETDFEYTKSSIFSWNFGDGSIGSGAVVTHTYDYPGEYTAVLSVLLSQGQAISRADVRIADPNLEITRASSQRIELKNNSKEEANLYGRALWSKDKTFVFPKDTIIKAGQSISFSSKVTGLRPNGIQDAQIMVIGNTEQPQIWKKIEEEKTEKIASIQARLSELKRQLANISSPAPNLAVRQLSMSTSSEEAGILAPQTALAKEGWLQTLKHFFLRTK